MYSCHFSRFEAYTKWHVYYDIFGKGENQKEIKISFQIVPKFPINNALVLIQVMPERQAGYAIAVIRTEVVMNQFTEAYVCHHASIKG